MHKSQLIKRLTNTILVRPCKFLPVIGLRHGTVFEVVLRPRTKRTVPQEERSRLNVNKANYLVAVLLRNSNILFVLSACCVLIGC